MGLLKDGELPLGGLLLGAVHCHVMELQVGEAGSGVRTNAVCAVGILGQRLKRRRQASAQVVEEIVYFPTENIGDLGAFADKRSGNAVDELLRVPEVFREGTWSRNHLRLYRP